MRKSRGQSLIEVAIIALLAFAFMGIGTYFFGDDLANLFSGNDAEARFNVSRTVRYENPEDLISDVEIVFAGKHFKPPIETILSGPDGYIQTSGSAGQVSTMVKIVEEYIRQLENIITPSGTGDSDDWNALFGSTGVLTKYKNLISSTASNGYLKKYKSATDELEKRLILIELCTSINVNDMRAEIDAATNNYQASISGPRKDIFERYAKDITNIFSNIKYNMDGMLYVKYLGVDKISGNAQQDKDLIDMIRKHMAGTSPYTSSTRMTSDEKAHLLGLIKVYYGGGLSIVSPTMYNGKKICDYFQGKNSVDTAASSYNECILCETFGCR